MSRPRVDNPVKGRDREGYNRYMREYMRRYRGGQRRLFEYEKPRAEIAAAAEFDPLRDGPPRYRDPVAAMMGDPPVGRSALDRLKT